MTEDTEDSLMTPEESSQMLIGMMAETEALKSLILEILTILAVAAPEATAALHRRTQSLMEKVATGDVILPDTALPQETMIAIKAEVIGAAMAMAQDPRSSITITPLRKKYQLH